MAPEYIFDMSKNDNWIGNFPLLSYKIEKKGMSKRTFYGDDVRVPNLYVDVVTNDSNIVSLCEIILDLGGVIKECSCCEIIVPYHHKYKKSTFNWEERFEWASCKTCKLAICPDCVKFAYKDHKFDDKHKNLACLVCVYGLIK